MNGTVTFNNFEPTSKPKDKITLLLKLISSFGHKYSDKVFKIIFPNFCFEILSGWTPSDGNCWKTAICCFLKI